MNSEKKPDAVPGFGLTGAVRLALRELWDRLGLVFGISLTWSLTLMVGMTAGLAVRGHGPIELQNGLASLLIVLLLAPATAGLYSLALRIVTKEPNGETIGYADFWRESRRLSGPAVRLGLVHWAVFGLLSLNFAFYARVHTGVGIAALFFSFDLLLFWSLMAVYHFPLLAAQESGKFDAPEKPAQRGVWYVLRRAFYLALGRPLFTLGLLVCALLLTALLLPLAGLILLLWPGALAFLLTAGTRNLLIQFGVIVLPPMEPIVPDEKFRLQEK